ncbi:hypothetical protein GCM10029964_046160 [Kibdelosporangium lantanae]
MTDAKSFYIMARVVDYVGVGLFLGGCAFVALIWPAGAGDWRTRRLLGIGWFLGISGTVAALLWQSVWAAQRPLDWSVVEQLLSVQTGRVWAAKALLWVLATVVLADLLRRRAEAARSMAWRVGAIVVGLGLLRMSGLTGHAQDAPQRTLTEVAALLHLTGICAWFGGLAVLLLGVLPRRRPEELATVVPRYSRLALASVVLVVLAGTTLAWQLVGPRTCCSPPATAGCCWSSWRCSRSSSAPRN